MSMSRSWCVDCNRLTAGVCIHHGGVTIDAAPPPPRMDAVTALTIALWGLSVDHDAKRMAEKVLRNLPKGWHLVFVGDR